MKIIPVDFLKIVPKKMCYTSLTLSILINLRVIFLVLKLPLHVIFYAITSIHADLFRILN